MHNLIIFGGSFDPPHLGHVSIALKIQKKFHFEKFIILPSKTQVLKGKHLSSLEDRIKMLRLTFPKDSFTIDLREVRRSTPSYMVTTLEDFRKEYGKDYAISLLIGMDSFLELPKWHQWKKILNLCNLLVVFRPNVNEQHISNELQQEINKRKTHNAKDLLNISYGLINFYNAGAFDISSTKLRELIQQNIQIKEFFPEKVYKFIQTNNLYKK